MNVLSCVLLLAAIQGGHGQKAGEYLSDIPDRLIQVEQGWGELGIDVCAHAAGQTPLKLCIGTKHYLKGLGNHAPGRIVVDLEGRYTTFDAEVGVQKQESRDGSVVFSAYVDGKKLFDSGVMRQDSPPKSVHLSLQGSQELVLCAGDAGDGIICDCADWADAKLTLSPNAKPSVYSDFDIAPFAEVTTWDPNRMDGARASRIEEYHAEDIYLDQPVRPSRGGYSLPANGCIGLLWLERRRPAVLTVEFGSTPAASFAEAATVQAWTGMYPFQGSWKPLVGSLKADGRRLTFAIDAKANPDFVDGFRKVRWVLRASPERTTSIAKLTATYTARMKTASIHVESEHPIKGFATIGGSNCLLAGNANGRWDTSKPTMISICYPAANRSTAASGQANIQISLGSTAFTVALGDILNGHGVYMKDEGVYLSRATPKDSLAAYKRQIAGQKTILQRVREMPDQTLSQAMKRTYHEIHFGSPTLLSLGPDNWKWLVDPDGTTLWNPGPEVAETQMPFTDRRCMAGLTFNGVPFHPTKSPTLPDGISRWMPIVALEAGDSSDHCRYTSFVAPVSNQGLFVGHVDLRGLGTSTLRIGFQRDRNRKAEASISLDGHRAVVMDGSRLMAIVDLRDLGQYQATVEGGVLVVKGQGAGSLTIAIPGWVDNETASDLSVVESGKLAQGFARYWRNVAAIGMQIEIPDPLLSDIVQTSRIRCIMDARNEENERRIAPWIAEIHYGPLESEANTIVRGMSLMGDKSFSEKSLDYFINLYNPAGFLTTGYTLVGTGWHLWTLGEAFELTQDKAWMAGHANEVARVCRWVVAQRHKTMKLDALGRKPPQYGLVPPGVIADWGAYQYYFYSNGTFCAGLETAGRALKAVGQSEADSFIAEAQAFRKDIARAYRWAQARTPAVTLQDGTWVAGQPSQTHCPGLLSGYYAGEDGSRSWCYDVELGSHNLVQQGILPPAGKDSREIADALEDVMFLKDGFGDYPTADTQRDWFDLGGFAKVQPYYGRLTEIYAMRDDVKPFIRSYFNMIASMIDPSNLTIWEHFDHLGAPDKTHETGVFLQQTRFMFVKERGRELWLAPFVPSAWMEDGKVVSIRHAPTFFGECGYRIQSHVAKGYIDATIDEPTRNAPSTIVIRLRHPKGLPMKSVEINGKRWRNFDPIRETVTVPVETGQVRIRANY